MMTYFDKKRDENELINIIIGLTFPRAKFPHPFFDLGYEIKAIEQSFINNSGKTVKPDLVIANKEDKFLIIFEAKSGKNAEKEQLKNYNEIIDNDLVFNAGFDRNLLQNGYETSYVCYKNTYIKNNKISAYKNLIKSIENKYDFAVLMYNKDKGYLSLELNKFNDKELNKIVNSVIDIPKYKIPVFINFDQHSDKEEIMSEAIRNILSYILNEKLEFTIEELTNDLISPYPGIENLIGSETKKAVKNKLVRVMRRIKNKKPNYFEWDNSEKLWKIDNNLKNPNYNQLSALRNIIVNDNDDLSDDQMSIFDI